MKTFTDKLNESISLPEKNGWYWVLINGYEQPTPCWYSHDEDGGYFLPGGMGDSSSMGLFVDDIAKVGPEIIVPEF
jgi:hypothetical protein